MTPNWENRTLFHGDNLSFLRAMNSESVDLIAADPPFKKGKDFHATPDSLADGASFQDRWSWDKDVHQDWADQITDDFPKLMNVIQGSRSSYGDDMGAFLCFMAVRLLEMRRVLKNTGSIFLHCDPTASHYLKELMDAIFGRQQFRNEIIWGYKTGGLGKKWFGRKHDVVLFFSKSNRYVFNVQYYRSYQAKKYNYNPNYPELWDQEEQKWYHNSICRDVWEDIKAIGTETRQKESYGYPTQKPIALYERIIHASSREGAVVLDPFCGCATTLVAAERLDRRWIGIDIWDRAKQAVIDRLKKEHLGMSSDEFQEWLILKGKITYSTTTPARTDDGSVAVPFLKPTLRVHEPKGPKMSRQVMYEFLVTTNGAKCQGCDRMFDDSRYLELDHNTPRSDGGLNHISNRILLCGPCNRLKSNTFTLSGLRRQNKKLGYMVK